MNLLRGLSPFGPIFGKELRVAARRRRNYLLRVAYLGGLLLFLLFAWSITHTWSFGPRGVAQRAQQQQQLGYYFFAFFSMFCVGAMALIGPVLTSTAINGERQAKTLHVLLMTPITAWQIISGKLFSRLLTALTLIGLSLPVLALCRLLGGVELDQMFGVLALSAVTAMFGAALGLLLSIMLRRAFAVIIVAYLSYAIVYVFAPMLVAGLMPDAWRRWPWWSYLLSYNPFAVTGILGWGQMRFMPVHWHVCVLLHVAATGVLLVVSAFLVRRIARHEGEVSIAPATEPSAMSAPLAPPVLNPSPPGLTPLAATRTKPRPTRTVSDYPVLWRELRRPLMTRAWQRLTGMIVVSVLLTLAYCAAAANRALDDKDFHAFLGCCFYSLMMLITCVISATSVAQEKEGETWTVLLASPVSGAAIIWGKALGVLRRLFWPMALVVGHFVVFTMAGVLSPMELLIGVGVCGMFNVIWVATGVALSLKLRKVTTAVIANLALPVTLYGAGSLVIAVIDTLLSQTGDLIEQIQWYLPYGYLVEGISRGSYQYTGYANHSGLRDFIDSQITLGEFTAIMLLIGLLHVAAAAVILWWTARQFNATVARAPQRDPLETPRPIANVSWAAGGS